MQGVHNATGKPPLDHIWRLSFGGLSSEFFAPLASILGEGARSAGYAIKLAAKFLGAVSDQACVYEVTWHEAPTPAAPGVDAAGGGGGGGEAGGSTGGGLSAPEVPVYKYSRSVSLSSRSPFPC